MVARDREDADDLSAPLVTPHLDVLTASHDAWSSNVVLRTFGPRHGFAP
jgi:hypothetical protein